MFYKGFLILGLLAAVAFIVYIPGQRALYVMSEEYRKQKIKRPSTSNPLRFESTKQKHINQALLGTWVSQDHRHERYGEGRFRVVFSGNHLATWSFLKQSKKNTNSTKSNTEILLAKMEYSASNEVIEYPNRIDDLKISGNTLRFAKDIDRGLPYVKQEKPILK